MAFVVRFTPPSLSSQQYDEVIKRLEAAGEGSPKGRLFAVAFGPTDALHVSDVWDTRENFDRFGHVPLFLQRISEVVEKVELVRNSLQPKPIRRDGLRMSAKILQCVAKIVIYARVARIDHERFAEF